jgi:hypothetical protein
MFLGSILEAYEEHTQKDRPPVRGFAGVAVKNISSYAFGEADQQALGSKPQVESKDS